MTLSMAWCIDWITSGAAIDDKLGALQRKSTYLSDENLSIMQIIEP